MEFSSVNAPSTNVSIVGFSSTENPHKRARFESLFGNSSITREQSGWTEDPSVANDDTAQTAPSTCTAELPEAVCLELEAERVYAVTPNATKPSDIDINPIALGTDADGKSKFGVVLTEPDSDETALVSVQWTAKETSWPAVFMSYQRIPGGVVIDAKSVHQGLAVFAVQHAAVVKVGANAKVGETLYW